MERMTAIIDRKEPKYVSLELSGGNEGVIKKKILFKNFIKLISSSVDNERKGIILGSLPNGYFNASVQEEETFKVIVSVPAGVYPFQYFDSTYSIPFPRLVFMFACEDGKVGEGRCYALKEDTITSDSLLHHYPFSNVYENGKIFFGRKTLPKYSK